jgi:hypothetical protein
MQIECKLQRTGGTAVKLGSTNYHFTPLTDGAHVAEVTVEEHIARFLSIPEGYRLYSADGVAPEVPAFVVAASAPVEEQEQEVEPILESVLHPADVTIGGVVYTVNQFARMGFVKADMSAEDWNSLSVDTRADFIDEALTVLNAAAPDVEDELGEDTPPPVIDEAAERVTLVAEYEAKLGKKPHHKLSVEKLRAAINEA